MDKQELKQKLADAKNFRDFSYYAEALTLLHQIVNEYPTAMHYYLLAGTYFESGEADPALEYADEALKVDPKYKNAYDLKARAYEWDKKYPEAEQMYLKALEIDPDFFDARNGLVDLYWHKTKDYEKVIEQCEWIFSQYDSFTFIENEFKVKFRWLGAFYSPAQESYIYLKKYKEAIKLILRYKYIITNYFPPKGDDEGTLVEEDVCLFKLYYLLGLKDELEQQQKYYQQKYNASDNEINSMKKDAEQGYIINNNWENYTIGENGEIL
jgi:tetratricopeptide (TPR) repeat protein